jgi:pSer/pThr/pTyr-binding forkhead associated (FHA) protein
MTAKLLVIQGKPQGKTLTFPPGEYVFGRGTECHVRPNSEWVSRQHCALRVEDEEAYVRDLGSRNGTLVNGQLIQAEQTLKHGDQLQVGPLVFMVQLAEEGVFIDDDMLPHTQTEVKTTDTAAVQMGLTTDTRDDHDPVKIAESERILEPKQRLRDAIPTSARSPLQ